LEFATGWNWRGKQYTRRGSKGAKPFAVNIWPCYSPDQDEPESYEKYCYARMILHHPFVNDPKVSLLKHCLDWTAACQSDCINQGHVRVDSLPTTCNENEADEYDSESIHDEDHEDEEWRAEWMQEAGRCPNQSVEMDFKNLGA
jgi:hypothetical protein